MNLRGRFSRPFASLQSGPDFRNLSKPYMHFLGRTGIVLILLFNIVCVSHAQRSKPVISKKKIEALQTYLSELDKLGFSGSILVAVDGRPVISKGFGYSDEERSTIQDFLTKAIAVLETATYNLRHTPTE